MTLKTLAQKIGTRLFPAPATGEPVKFEEYRLDPAVRDQVAKDHDGALADVFFGPKDRLVDKWLHYLDVYEKHFAQFRDTKLNFLEIGVYKGGSLEMWRSYFGPEAAIWGVDIDPQCRAYETPGTRVRIGSQDDPVFLRGVIDEMGAPDLILDDGSHVAAHQEASFRTLFPLLKDGGLYVIEDLHTSYWGDFGGGYRVAGTGLERVKDMIDDMHAWYHSRPTSTPAKQEIAGIYVYDSIVVIEKKRKARPAFIQVPGRLSLPSDVAPLYR